MFSNNDNNAINTAQEKVLTLSCSNVQEYVEKILEFSKSKEKISVYRGVPDSSYQLIPSVGRNNYSEELEKQFFLQFKRQYHLYTNIRVQNDMDVLFLAQHYGLPTRLLDWSYNPLVALFFACYNDNEDEIEKNDGRVYIYHLNRIIDCSSNSSSIMLQSFDEIMSQKEDIFLIPDCTDERYRNQRALFSLCGNPSKELDLNCISIFINKEKKKKIIEDLALLGCDRAFIYPLLDSLCRDIKNLIIK